MRRYLGFSLGLCVLGASGFAQTGGKLTLEQAVRLARKNNGTIIAAEQEMRAARARVQNAEGAFLPDITPSYIYSDSRREIADTNFGTQGLSFIQNSTQIQTRFQVFDTGQRAATLRARKKSFTAAEARALQSVRQTLFTVHQQYLETLRTQELQRVADSQVARATLVLDQTKARVQVGDAAKREVLQATADSLNATVNSITAKNRTFTNGANLKATIGLDKEASLPQLEPVPLNTQKAEIPALEKLLVKGIAERADLVANREDVGASKDQQRLAMIDAGFAISGNFTYDLQLTPARLANQNYSLVVSYPLFDGFQRRAALNESKANVSAAQARLVQAERTARAEIESAYLTYVQNLKRVEAAKVAADAARQNYQSAVESQKLGASDLIEVLTAQVSLVTSETNLIEATFDTLISELSLKLATGQPIPGE